MTRRHYAVDAPQNKLGDLRYLAFHGRVTAAYTTPGVRCVCRSRDAVPYYGGYSFPLMVPKLLQAEWPSLPGMVVTRDDVLAPQQWTAWQQRLESETGVRSLQVRPWMTLDPVSYSRRSTQPFAVLFPFEGTSGLVVSSGVRRCLEDASVVGAEFSELIGFDGHVLHARTEAPFRVPMPRCVHCHGITLDAAARGNLARIARPLDLDVQVVLGFGVVISDRVRELLMPEFERALNVPTLTLLPPDVT